MPKEEPTQRTQPYGTNDDGTPAEPIDIPVPKREDILDLFRRSAQPVVEHADKSAPREAHVPPISPRKIRQALSRRRKGSSGK